MLRVLRIENLAVVASAHTEFRPGLRLLTGQRVAGRSIVIDARAPPCGERADGDLIRTGEEKGTVEAIFELPKGFSLGSLGLGIDDTDGEIAIRREILSSGRSRAMVNGVTVALASLKAVGQAVVQIQGQHQQHALLDPEFHLLFLDRFAGLEADAERARDLYARAHAADAELSAFRERARQFGREHEMLKFQVDEIRRAGLRSGEEEELREERVRLRNGARLTELATEATSIVDGSDDPSDVGVLQQAKTLLKRLD